MNACPPLDLRAQMYFMSEKVRQVLAMHIERRLDIYRWAILFHVLYILCIGKSAPEAAEEESGRSCRQPSESEGVAGTDPEELGAEQEIEQTGQNQESDGERNADCATWSHKRISGRNDTKSGSK